MGSTYQHLRQDGFQFPPEERLAASFVDTAAPPDWSDSEVCMRCRTAFTFTNRKHHCRSCGNVFCGQCSTQTMPLPQLGITTPVRVCDGCFAKKQHGATKKMNTQASPSKARAPPREDEDMDLKRALELSLAESKNAEVRQAPQPAAAAPIPVAQDEDDADLKAAIEASLREAQPVATAHAPAPASANGYSLPQLDQTALQLPQVSTQYASKQPEARQMPSPSNPHALQPSEAENINLFATLVDRLKSSDTRSGILRDAQIQELYEGISSLRSKLARSLGDAVGKYESLVETHSKLATVQKYYDRLLEARLESTYGGRGYSGYETQDYGHDVSGYYGESQSEYYSQGTAVGQPPAQHQQQGQPQRQYGAQYDPGNQQHQSQHQSQHQQAARHEEVSLIDL
ncbi:hypothetical protein BCR37DRAFT_46569 [Protomyces lactucae-debilis]|uniref:FYVE-type domain-containing protein n=1 Tax=Protomyces lactucae-debilis TaxID=2754530 RepID=A0A1Y2FFA8_PROLT|nr:uncharacterized protein BCR37DRAFT_46569 [Protomyces lactucae-debilis]ORY81515.1 hypothetical protein BCR37DRAFT_46569 [Protomyces lactucae-debilis]